VGGSGAGPGIDEGSGFVIGAAGGGGAGAAITGNANIIWAVEGTRLGSIVT
jgi:hypothetical protein